MYCGKCGFNTGGEGNFCKNCGASLNPAVNIINVKKKKKVSPAFKYAWFAPAAVVVSLFVMSMATALTSVFSGWYQNHFMDDMDFSSEKFYETIKSVLMVIFRQPLFLLSCFFVYLIVFKKVNKTVKSRLSLVFLVPYASFTVLNYLVGQPFSMVASTFVLLDPLDFPVHLVFNQLFQIIVILASAFISYLLSWKYLKNFEKELKN